MRRFLLALAVIAVGAGASYGITLSDKMYGAVRQGNRHYEDGEHDQALKKYLEAGQVDSSHSVPHFNAGDALYRLGKFPEGAREFLNASSSAADSIAAMSYYNLGNSLYNAGDLESAAEAYRRSLLIRPDDEDAKYNLELALRVMEEKQQDKEQQDKEQRDDEKRQPQDRNGEDRAKEREKQDEGQQDQNQGQQTREETEPEPTPGEISPEELERILAAIEASDKNTQEEMLKNAAKRKSITDKDW